jgi:hypothetical protein
VPGYKKGGPGAEPDSGAPPSAAAGSLRVGAKVPPAVAMTEPLVIDVTVAVKGPAAARRPLHYLLRLVHESGAKLVCPGTEPAAKLASPEVAPGSSFSAAVTFRCKFKDAGRYNANVEVRGGGEPWSRSGAMVLIVK